MIHLHKISQTFAIVLVISLSLTSVTFAQRDTGGGDRGRTGGGQSFESPEFSSPDRPAPGDNGGNLGGPSMGGEAVNAGRDDTRPDRNSEREEGSGPDRNAGEGGISLDGQTGEGRGGSRGNANEGGINLGGNTDEGGIGSGGNPGREGGISLGGETGEGSISGLQDRFGERGNSNLPINFGSENDDSPPWLNNFQRGGFGSVTGGFLSEDGGFGGIDGDSRLPDEFNGEAAPGAFDDLEALNEALVINNEVQNTVQDAAEQASDAVNEAANNATDAAQGAYDTFWNDYYAAVDATADAYYETTTEVADYYFEVYVDAVNYTTDSIDYYIDYAAQYADYCVVYPFDCYSYTYDYSTNTYYYTGDVSTEPSGTAEAGTVTPDTSLDTAEPVPSADAYEAVVLFANDHLAAAVEPLYAGSATPEMQDLLTQFPDQISAHVLNSTVIAGETYWGLLNGGMAGVMIGDCTDGECQVTDANLSMLLSTESSGVYGLVANTAYPPNASGALQLITDVYPKLDGLVF
ncbi:MAG: hypothetical protein AAGK74_05380, partial [Chloroflexota bacterium]